MPSSAYIKDIHLSFVDKEALKQTLDHHMALSKHEHYRVEPSSRLSLEDHQEQELRNKGKRKKNQIHQERNDGQREKAAKEHRVKLGMAQEVVYALDGVCGGARSTADTIDGAAKRSDEEFQDSPEQRTASISAIAGVG